jgi:hypothetical protein
MASACPPIAQLTASVIFPFVRSNIALFDADRRGDARREQIIDIGLAVEPALPVITGKQHWHPIMIGLKQCDRRFGQDRKTRHFALVARRAAIPNEVTATIVP